MNMSCSVPDSAALDARLSGIVDQIRNRTALIPEAAMILGSGLDGVVDMIESPTEISYRELNGMPVSTVSGHEGKYIFGTLSGVRVVCMKGRVHYYEGYEMSEVVIPTRVMALLGAKVIIITSSAGGIRKDLHCGDFMAVTDHISGNVPSPLRGYCPASPDNRFPDMSCAYDPALRRILHETGSEIGINVSEGVFIQTAGPQFETPAEIRKYARDGADAVSMSLACEAAAARQMGMRVCGVVCISNPAAGVSDEPITWDVIYSTGKQSSARLAELIRRSLPKMLAL